MQEELVHLVESLRASVSERDHRIVVLRWVRDRSVSEIACELSLTEDCVKSVLYRVSLRLRELLRRRGLVPSEGNPE